MEKIIPGYKCESCGTIHYPNRARCKKCGHDVFQPVALPLDGKLLTFTSIHNLPADFEITHINLGIVELENGVRVTGQLKTDEMHIGMPVRGKVEVVRQSDYRKYHGWTFYPIEMRDDTMKE
ncbi:MAG: OB-fold domain-containing protein [Candidatus Riflebacteria bacterium]|nr:OB-fold domain-containing protein [Candidatus Riflebacteria bacterium]